MYRVFVRFTLPVFPPSKCAINLGINLLVLLVNYKYVHQLMNFN